MKGKLVMALKRQVQYEATTLRHLPLPAAFTMGTKDDVEGELSLPTL